ncbi:MAG: Transcriptional regulatory protein DegU [Anaerolineae bacterium]|nr:Transcriptional regulatory protein DegU [Anaerolineae bacterium]
MDKTSVLIADDHQIVREGLLKVLQASDEFEVIGQATNGREAIELAKLHRPQVVIVDIQMPDVDGIETTATITRQVPMSNVVILSSYDQDEYIYKSLQAGAKSYALKGDNIEVLLEVVRAAARGKSLLPPHIATRLVNRIAAPQPDSGLTAREVEVLKLLAEGLRNKEIGEALHITERTVKNHVAKIITKLNVKSRTEAVSYAIKNKLIELK